MDLFKIREALGKAGILICFNGPFSHSIIDEIGQAVRNYLAAESQAKATSLDVFAIYIELAQNVKNYVTSRQLSDEAASACIITIAKKDGSYQITSGNVVLAVDIAPLVAAVEAINALEPAELKKRYREQLRKDHSDPASGAGLGLMDVAKRSTTKLRYRVTPMDDSSSFFSLTASV